MEVILETKGAFSHKILFGRTGLNLFINKLNPVPSQYQISSPILNQLGYYPADLILGP